MDEVLVHFPGSRLTKYSLFTCNLKLQ